MTSEPTLWEVARQVLPSDRWMKLADLLHEMENRMLLDDEDRDQAWHAQEKGQRWQRNVRNALQNRRGIAVERGERGYYRLKQDTASAPIQLPEEVPEGVSYTEGRVQQIFVNRFERDPRARKACLEFHGVTCKVCGFNFGAVYGPLAEGVIHVHHLVPLATIGAEYTVDPHTDLLPVCANCHAIIHWGANAGKLSKLGPSSIRGFWPFGRLSEKQEPEPSSRP